MPLRTSVAQFKSIDSLAQWLGSSPTELHELISLPTDKKYRTFLIPRRNGRLREISAPIDPLKSIQRRIASLLEEVRPPSKIAIGYAKGKSIYDHASPHLGKRWVLTIDLSDFFGSISIEMIVRELRSAPIQASDAVANRLAALACRNRSLPQGGPLSPVLSNYCCRNLDRDLRGLAEEQGLTVSRYADDICFSGNDDSFPAIATGHGRSAVVSTILHELFDKNGFRINERKTNLSIGARRKMVTGLLVGKSVSMPYKWRRQLRALRHIVEKYGESRAQEIVSGWDSRTVRKGKIGSIERTIEGKLAFAAWLERKNAELLRLEPKDEQYLEGP